MQSAPDTRYVAIKTGSIEFKDDDRTIRAGGGDTLYIPRGATYSWTASGAAAAVVAIAPAAS